MARKLTQKQIEKFGWIREKDIEEKSRGNKEVTLRQIQDEFDISTGQASKDRKRALEMKGGEMTPTIAEAMARSHIETLARINEELTAGVQRVKDLRTGESDVDLKIETEIRQNLMAQRDTALKEVKLLQELGTLPHFGQEHIHKHIQSEKQLEHMMLDVKKELMEFKEGLKQEPVELKVEKEGN